MSDFVLELFHLCFFVFDKQDNPVVFLPFFVIYFCGCFAILRMIVYRKF